MDRLAWPVFFSTTFIMIAIGFSCLGLITGLYHPAGLKMVSNSPNISKYILNNDYMVFNIRSCMQVSVRRHFSAEQYSY